ncbi:MAG: inositol monophosphatase family protein [Pseudomonadota bacterium]
MRDFQPEQIDELEYILQQASSVALDWCARRSDLAIDEKSIGQFATNVDLELETLIRKLLTQHFPGTAIIGEEFGGTLSEAQSGWAIDPIDGTTNFIMGLPIWGVSIGYIEKGRSVA